MPNRYGLLLCYTEDSSGLEATSLPVGGAKSTLVNPSRLHGEGTNVSKASLQHASRF